MLKTIILSCSSQLKDERTDQAIYHILQGKKSIQTVQDIFLYKLDAYYRILPRLNQTFFKETIEELVHEQHMKPSNVYKGSYTITSEGKGFLEKTTFPSIISCLNGQKHSAYAEKFEQKLFLFFQVLSNKQARNNTYVPIIDDYQIMNEIKSLFGQLQQNSKWLANQLYSELTNVLRKIDDQYAHIFVNRLSGYEHYGKSISQIANNLHMSEIDIQILFKSIIHYILEQIDQRKEQLPLLSLLIIQDEKLRLTASAHQTKRLLDKGLTLKQIASNRTLKKNTIYDHIVEIALYDDTFDIHQFIDERAHTIILQTALELNTYQLKELKDALGDDYSYFQIRLALTRGGTISE